MTGSGRLPALCSTSRQPVGRASSSTDQQQLASAADDRPPVQRQVEQRADRGPRRAAVGDGDERARPPARRRARRATAGTHPRRDLGATSRRRRPGRRRRPARRRSPRRPAAAISSTVQALPGAAVRLAQPRVVAHRRAPASRGQRRGGVARPGPGRRRRSRRARAPASSRAAAAACAGRPRRARRRAGPGSGPRAFQRGLAVPPEHDPPAGGAAAQDAAAPLEPRRSRAVRRVAPPRGPTSGSSTVGQSFQSRSRE